MRSKITYESSDGASQRVTALLIHKEDRGITAALNVAETLSTASYLSPLVTVECANTVSNTAHTIAHILTQGRWESVRLLDALHTADSPRAIDVIVTGTSALPKEHHGELAEAGDRIRTELWKAVPPGTRVVLLHTWFPDYGEDDMAPPREWFRYQADSTLVVLPEDRQHEKALAMPMTSAHPESYSWHVMTELASIIGLWSTMQGAPLEFIKPTPTGTNEVAVRLVRSMCRLVRVKTPSVEESRTDRGSLPIPPGHITAPDPFHMVRIVEPSIYPDEFRADHSDTAQWTDPGSRPDPESDWETYNPDNLLSWVRSLLAGGDIAKDTVIRLKAFVDQMEHQYPWIAPLVNNEASAPGEKRRSRLITMQMALDALYGSRPPVSLTSIPTSGWDRLLERTLGVIDGTTTAAAVRGLAGDERYVIVDRSALVPIDGDLRTVLSSLEGVPPDSSANDTEQIRKPESDNLKKLSTFQTVLDTLETAGSDSDQATLSADTNRNAPHSGTSPTQLTKPHTPQPDIPDPVKQTTKPPAQSATDDIDPRPTLKQTSRSVSDTKENTEDNINTEDNTNTTTNDEDLPTLSETPDLDILRLFKPTREYTEQLTHRKDSEPSPNELFAESEGEPLLLSVTQAFDSELRKAGSQACDNVKQLSEYLSLDNRPLVAVSRHVKTAFAASLLIFVILLATRIKPLNIVLSPDRFPIPVRVGFFLFLSVLATLPAMLRRLPTVSDSTQNKLTFIAIVYAAVLLACVLFASQLSALDYSERPWPTILIVVLVVSILVWGQTKPFKATPHLLGAITPLVSRLAPLMTAITYTSIVLVATVNLDTIRDQIDRLGIRLSLILFSFTGTAFGVTAWLIQRVRRLHRDELRRWEDECCDLLEEAEIAANDRDVLDKLRTHWLGTAVVLARLINRPFGTVHTSHSMQQIVNVKSPIRKVTTASISLQEERDVFLQRALPELTPPGWLLEQYRRLSEQYTAAEQLRTGNSDVPRPEWCAYPVNTATARSGQAHGRRWPFAYQVYKGDFDEMLRHAADEALSEALLKTLHDASVKVVVNVNTSTPKSLTEILGELLPQTDNRLPISILPQQITASPEYEPMLWWPERVEPEACMPNSSEHRSAYTRPFTPRGYCAHVIQDDGMIILQAVRVDVSSPILASRLATHLNEVDNHESVEYPTAGMDDDISQFGDLL